MEGHAVAHGGHGVLTDTKGQVSSREVVSTDEALAADQRSVGTGKISGAAQQVGNGRCGRIQCLVGGLAGGARGLTAVGGSDSALPSWQRID